MILSMLLRAHRAGVFRIVMGATLFRADGVFVTNLVSAPMSLELSAGDSVTVELELGRLNLGDGTYLFSLSAFEGHVSDDTRYDLVSRAYEFRVIGGDPLHAGAVFQHEGAWRVNASSIAGPSVTETARTPTSVHT